MDRITEKKFATRSEVIAPHGMVATSHPLATQVGVEVLKAGGSAVDAAIAANAALGVMEPVNCGIGGDLFAIAWEAKTRRLHGLNGSGRSPLALSLDRMRAELARLGRTTIPPTGMLPISVPGAVDAWFELHARFGRLPIARVLAPAIEYAENGFPVTEVVAHEWERNVAALSSQPGAFLETFTVGGRAPAKGEMFRNPALASTYRAVAAGGRDAFYRGEIAREMDAFFRASGGWLRAEDFAQHSSSWVDPVSVNYRGYDVFEMPPNTQGVAALQMLKILEGFDLRATGFADPRTLHLMIEAKKLAFEDRARFYADPDFARAPLAGLLSEKYAASRRALIDPAHTMRAVDAGTPALNDGDTIYLTTADRDGNMVSLIQSNYRGMGSGIVVPGLGFGFQDRGELFAMEPGHANVYAPGKRPFHTIIPAFVMKDGEPWLSFGVMGGAMQPQGHVQVLVNLIDFEMNLQEAGDAPRWQHFGSTEPTGTPALEGGGFVEMESRFGDDTREALRRLGHDIRTGDGGFGGYQAIRRDVVQGVYFAASESRKDGHAAGY